MKVTPSRSGTIPVGVGGGVAGKPPLSTQHASVRPLLIITKLCDPGLFLKLERLIMWNMPVVIARDELIIFAAVIKTALVSELMTKSRISPVGEVAKRINHRMIRGEYLSVRQVIHDHVSN